jgi:Tol biopolymer transport system component
MNGDAARTPADSVSRTAAAVAMAVLAAILISCVGPAVADPMISRIAYSSSQGSANPQIWLVNPDGSYPRRITTNYAGGDGAAISPDGTQIAFESPRYGWANIFLIRTDGTGEHRLLSTNFYCQSATWSPDGTSIAFTHSSTNGGAGGIGTTWVVHADGSDLVQLSPSSTDDWMPCWSPDGTRIAFQSHVADLWQIFLMNADGSGRQQFTSGPGDKYGPRWSPDGTRLAYTLFPDPDVPASSIHVLGVDVGGDIAVTDTTGVNGRPCWSPDGSEIAFHSNRYGNFRILRINADGTNLRQVTAGATAPGDWGGDWRMVAVAPAGVEEGIADPRGGDLLSLVRSNPMRAPSTLWYTTAREGDAALQIFDGAGRMVRVLTRQHVAPGTHSALWDGRDDGGIEVPSGVYFCRLVSGDSRIVSSFVLLR